jgi:hypothetical protein
MRERKNTMVKDATYGAALGGTGAVVGYFSSAYTFCRSYLPAQIEAVMQSPKLHSSVFEKAVEGSRSLKEILYISDVHTVSLMKNRLSEAANTAIKVSADLISSGVSDTCMSAVPYSAVLKVGAVGAATGLGLALAYYWWNTGEGRAEKQASKASLESAKVVENEQAIVSEGPAFFAPKKGSSPNLEKIIQANPFNFSRRPQGQSAP